MAEITGADRAELFEEVIASLGGLGPISPSLEIDNKIFDIYLRMTIKEYSAFINGWLATQQFPYMQGLNIDTADITLALTTKTMDFEASFAASYAKQFGVGNSKFSTWELKKDFVVISSGTQVYTIPPNREVNEVLWMTPPNLTNLNGLGSIGMGGWNFGPTGWVVGGVNMNALLPSYNLMLYAQDRQQKRKLLESELTYRVTPGPNKTKLLFLYPMPGSGDEMSGPFGRHLDGSHVFYFYYDTNSGGRKKCLEENNDIIKTPNDIPIDRLKYTQLNETSKLRVRELLVAKLLEFLSINRSKFSGDGPQVNSNTLKLDYGFLQDRADKEKERIYALIEGMLNKLTYAQIMEDRASIAENLNRILQYQPSRVQYLIT